MASLHVGTVLAPTTGWASWGASFVLTPPEVPCPIQGFSLNGPRTALSLATETGYMRLAPLTIVLASDTNALSQVTLGNLSGLTAISQLQETDVVAISGRLTGSNEVHLVTSPGANPQPIAQCPEKVLGIQLLDGHVIVLTSFHCLIYQWSGAAPTANSSSLTQPVADILTIENPWAIFAVHSTARGQGLVLVPDPQVGHVGAYALSGTRRYHIAPHTHRIGLISFSQDGSYFVTASEGSTNFKLYARQTGHLVRELRRGTTPHRSYFAAFDTRLKFLATVSVSGTLHIFSLGRREPARAYEVDPEVRNKETMLRPLAIVNSYFDSEWSCVNQTLPIQMIGIPSVCTFVSDLEIAVICAKGHYVQYVFDPVKGTIVLKGEKQLL